MRRFRIFMGDVMIGRGGLYWDGTITYHTMEYGSGMEPSMNEFKSCRPTWRVFFSDETYDV